MNGAWVEEGAPDLSLLLSAVKLLQLRVEVLVACPSQGKTTDLVWLLKKEGALYSWLHAPEAELISGINGGNREQVIVQEPQTLTLLTEI